jgi:hypothetical protein
MLDECVQMIGDVDRVIHMIVGDTQRLGLDALTGAGVLQQTPDPVSEAYRRLAAAG